MKVIQPILAEGSSGTETLDEIIALLAKAPSPFSCLRCKGSDFEIFAPSGFAEVTGLPYFERESGDLNAVYAALGLSCLTCGHIELFAREDFLSYLKRSVTHG